MLLRVRFRLESIMSEIGKDQLKNYLKRGTQR